MTRRATEWALAAEAFVALAAASLAVRILPFRLIARWLGAPVAPQEEAAAAGPMARDTVTRGVVLAVERASRRAWWRPKCLARALAGRFMLARRNMASTVVLGVAVRKDAGRAVDAHAWLKLAGTPVLGGEEAPRFMPIARFGREPN